jgi:hypothetical protein
MRLAAIALALLMSACGSTAGGTAASGRSSAPATIRPTTATTRDCTVDWVDHFKTMRDLAAKAEVIVRAVALSQDTTQLKAFAAGNVVSLRDARRTTFRVVDTLKGSAPAEMRVLEDVCQNLDVKPGEEWLLFAYRWDNAYGPDGGGEHFVTDGGPQGQFRFSAGKVIGPFYVFADVVHSYEGASIDEVMRDVRTVVR